MADGPRRQRPNAWAWLYLALFTSDEESPDAETRAENGDEAR
jgi:hypothetical protein